ncbi:hypothetical protein MMPV_001694 [Pyropia vietnamensis]
MAPSPPPARPPPPAAFTTYVAGMTVRSWAPSDTPAVAAVIDAALAEHGLTFEPTGADADVLDPAAAYGAVGGEFWVVLDGEADGTVVGSAAWRPAAAESAGTTVDAADATATAAVLATTTVAAPTAADPVAATTPITAALAATAGRVEVRKMYLAPAARRRGVGAFLLAAAEARAAAAGATVAAVETASALAAAVALYEASGYTPVTDVATARCDAAYEKVLATGEGRGGGAPPPTAFPTTGGGVDVVDTTGRVLFVAPAAYAARVCALVRGVRVLVLPPPSSRAGAAKPEDERCASPTMRPVALSAAGDRNGTANGVGGSGGGSSGGGGDDSGGGGEGGRNGDGRSGGVSALTFHAATVPSGEPPAVTAARLIAAANRPGTTAAAPAGVTVDPAVRLVRVAERVVLPPPAGPPAVVDVFIAATGGHETDEGAAAVAAAAVAAFATSDSDGGRWEGGGGHDALLWAAVRAAAGVGRQGKGGE